MSVKVGSGKSVKKETPVSVLATDDDVVYVGSRLGGPITVEVR